MTESSLALQTDRLAPIVSANGNVSGLADILRDFIRLKPRLKTLLPEGLMRVKERLGLLHPEDGPRRAADYDLFYRVGIALSRPSAPLTMGELSEALVVPLSTATRMVDWLVESGYAERLPDPEDRRIVRVTLTETGQELYQTINGFLRQRVEQILQRFTAEERENLVLLLRKVVEALEELESLS
jgi:DNA-binding MarR family transcriptional regulator